MSKRLLYMVEPRQATWLELFFDLIFVVALGKVTHLLAHTHHGHLEPNVWPVFFLTFIPLWWLWVGHTVYSNRFDSDARPHRFITLFIMFLMLLMSVKIDGHIHRHYGLFVGVYGIARLIIAGLYFRSAKNYPDKAEFASKVGLCYMIGALVSMSALLVKWPMAFVLFYAGICIDMIAPKILKGRLPKLPVHRDHLIERMGLLAIILLGESIISMSSSLGDVAWNSLTVITATCGFAMLCMIWWIYFDSFPLLIESKRDVNGNAILYSQLLTYMSFAILANTIRHAILNDLSIDEFRIMTVIGMVMFYLGKQTAYFVNIPEYRKYIIINTVGMLIVVGISLFFNNLQYIMMGTAFSMVVYILLNWRAQMILYGNVKL